MAANFLHKLLNELPEESRWIILGQLKFKTEAELYDLILQLEQDILRKVLIKKGQDSEDYKFFQRVSEAIYQAGEAAYLTEQLNEEIKGLIAYNNFLQQRLNEAEVKLHRFVTIEEMTMEGVLESYIERVHEVMKDSLKNRIIPEPKGIDEKLRGVITPRILRETVHKKDTDGD